MEWKDISWPLLIIIMLFLSYYGLYHLIIHIIKEAIRYRIEYEYQYKHELEILEQLDKMEKEMSDFENKNSQR